MKKCLLFCAVMLCLVTVSQTVAEVLEGPNGPVEFIGLKNWTAPKLFEAIQETSDRGFHACAAVMKSELEFPDAAAFIFFDTLEDGSWRGYTVVVGVEDDTGVQYRTPGSETIELPEAWQKLKSVAEEEFNSLSALVYARYEEVEDTEKAKELAVQLGANPETLDEVWTLVGTIEESADHDLALAVLAKDASWSSRFVATMVLGFFPERDASWHALTGSLIDPSPQVMNMASRVIQGLTKADSSYQVQWSEALETLLALFAGTNPFAFNEVLEALIATEIDPEFGRALVQQKPELLLAHAGAEHEKFSKPAQDFLVALSGKEFGRDVEAWAEWIKDPSTDP